MYIVHKGIRGDDDAADPHVGTREMRGELTAVTDDDGEEQHRETVTFNPGTGVAQVKEEVGERLIKHVEDVVEKSAASDAGGSDDPDDADTETTDQE